MSVPVWRAGKHPRRKQIAHEPLASPLVVSGWCGATQLLGRDAAGHVFHELALRQAGLYVEALPADDEAGSSNSDTTEATARADEHFSAGWQGKNKKKKKQKGTQQDLYALLGLANERWTANDNQIKLAYRRTALEYHPDKAGAGVTDDAKKRRIEEHFQSINDAYAILSDPARRREYDSIDDFDDSLPSTCEASEFFKVFGAAFKRNSRWSQQKGVPDVGTEATSIDDVERFYDFWFTFKSWREFPHPDEEDLEQAENREHKRWIERYNNKLRQAAKKEETRRLKAFVNDAYAHDPRILKQRAQEKAERDRRKAEKESAKLEKQRREQQSKEEAAAAAAAAQQAASEQAAVDKKARQLEKKAVQKQRSRLRGLCVDLVAGKHLEDDDVELVCSQGTLQQLQQLTDALAANGLSIAQRCQLVESQVAALQGEEKTQRRAKDKALKAAAAAAAAEKHAAAKAKQSRMREWDEEEIRMLEKALVKFPQGTAKRWDQVTGYVRTRTADEIIEMAKHGLKAGRGIKPQDVISIAKKRQGNTVIASNPTGRLEAFTDVDVNLAGEAVKTLANGHASASELAADPAPQQQQKPPDSKAAADRPIKPAAAKQAAASLQANSSVGPEPAQQDLPAAGAVQQAAGEQWTEEEELALVQALKQHGKDLSDRWDRIAKDLPGKTKKQCQARFKELKSNYKGRKS